MKKYYYEIYKVESFYRLDRDGGSESGLEERLVTIVETKEIAEDFCKRHNNCIYKEYSVQVAAGCCN